jgi:Ubiquitin carboxyl-terminal hydrolase
VSNHYGSLAFGHYTAYGKNAETGKWHDFNDSSVSVLSDYSAESEVVTNAAYVLYYIRRNFFPSKDINFESIKIMLEPELQQHTTQEAAQADKLKAQAAKAAAAQVSVPYGDSMAPSA